MEDRGLSFYTYFDDLLFCCSIHRSGMWTDLAQRLSTGISAVGPTADGSDQIEKADARLSSRMEGGAPPVLEMLIGFRTL